MSKYDTYYFTNITPRESDSYISLILVFCYPFMVGFAVVLVAFMLVHVSAKKLLIETFNISFESTQNK